MSVHVTRLEVATRGRGFTDLTAELRAATQQSGLREGLASVFVHHTSASLFINENADPAVRRDLEAFMARLVPDGDPLFSHVAEGPDDMPAHVSSVLTATSLTVPVADGRPALGTWQGLYLWEHRSAPHRRRVTITLLG
ncbi:MAG: secondary thiamine-phosphate synthase enzyme YjbQ [Myxococcota bacterium]